MKRIVLLLSIMVFTIMAISSCAYQYDKRAVKREAKLEIVKIWLEEDKETKKKKPKVDKEEVWLSARAGDAVMWKMKTEHKGKEFKIKFKNEFTPFGGKTEFSHDDPFSGPPTVAPTDEPVEYFYSVEIDGEILDPGVIIWQ